MLKALGLLCRGSILKKSVRSGGGGRLRDIYKMFFKYHNLLPDTVAKQEPRLLLKVLDALDESEEEFGSEHLRMFYGQ